MLHSCCYPVVLERHNVFNQWADVPLSDNAVSTCLLFCGSVMTNLIGIHDDVSTVLLCIYLVWHVDFCIIEMNMNLNIHWLSTTGCILHICGQMFYILCVRENIFKCSLLVFCIWRCFVVPQVYQVLLFNHVTVFFICPANQQPEEDGMNLFVGEIIHTFFLLASQLFFNHG